MHCFLTNTNLPQPNIQRKTDSIYAVAENTAKRQFVTKKAQKITNFSSLNIVFPWS